MAEERNPEDAKDVSCGLGDESRDEGPKGDAAEERTAEVSEGYAARGGRRDVRAVRVSHGHCGGKGSKEAVEDGPDKEPLVVHSVRVGGSEDSNDLGAEAAEDGERKEVLAPVAVGERANLRTDDSAQDASQEGHVHRELGRQCLHFGDLTLRVVGEHDDGRVQHVGVQCGLLGDVALADQREDEVQLRNDDAAKGNGVDGVGGEEPPDLGRVNGRG